MGKRIVERIAGGMDRRSFLGKLTLSVGALVAGVFAAPKEAKACFQCCGLCTVPGTCVYGNCACVWGWLCCTPAEPIRIYACGECFDNPLSPCEIDCLYDEDCGRTCAGVKCSRAKLIGSLDFCPG